MSERPLQISVAPRAARLLRERGWRGCDVQTLLGASGGPKWLILGHLDRVLFGEFLLRERQTPLTAVGSSIGSWRHACLAQPDPVAAVDRFETSYLQQRYETRPTPAEVSEISARMLADILGPDGGEALINHRCLESHIVTARGRGLAGSVRTFPLLAGMGMAAVGNAASRRLLSPSFQRVIFHSNGARLLTPRDFATRHVALTAATVSAALHASGAIPFVLSGERDIPGAPRGQYWDGGIIDYHFDLADFYRASEAQDGLVLYPHFRADITPGWFDKLLPWRRRQPDRLDNLVLLSPSATFIRSLPGGKIPDRSDFKALSTQQRLDYWQLCIERSRELAEDFQRQCAAADPLMDVHLLEAPEGTIVSDA